MKKIIISPLTKKLQVHFSRKHVVLPPVIQNKIDAYWNDLIKSGKKYKRGEVFAVTKKEHKKDCLDILVEKTDYAHYLYCQNVGMPGKNGVHIIHTAVLVETSDEKFLFGKMNKQTSRSGIYQLCGGGIDNDDLRDTVFDLSHNIKKELKEELGIDADNSKQIKTFELAYFKEGGPTDKMTAIYKIALRKNSAEFMQEYNKFILQLRKNNEQPEFSDLIF